MNPGSRALPCAKLAAPASRNSLTSRSCRVLCARSTRPLAGLELAQMMSMLSACKARPNWVIPSPPSAPGRLAFDKLQVHQPARRIVDKHQQRALRPAVFEPPMFAAVDLHQLANALAPMARLVNTPAPLFAVEPQPLMPQRCQPDLLVDPQVRTRLPAGGGQSRANPSLKIRI